MECREKNAHEMSPADSITAASVKPSNSHGGDKRHHRRSSKKRQRTLGDLSPTYDSGPEFGGLSSPHSRKKPRKATGGSTGRRGRASPDLNATLPRTDEASASAPAPESFLEPSPASSPEKRPDELSEPGEAEYPARSYASPTMSALEIAAVPAMWSPRKTADEEKDQAKIVLPVIVAAVVVGLVGAFIFSLMISGHRAAKRIVSGHSLHGANATDTPPLNVHTPSLDVGHPGKTLEVWSSNDDAGMSRRMTRRR